MAIQQKELAAEESFRLDCDEVHVWWIELDRVPERRQWLDDRERARADRFLVPGAARQLVRSHTALRALLGGYLGVPPAEVEITIDAGGRPRLAAGGPDFNLSHSAAMAAVGIAARGRLGVDVEHRSERPFDQLAARFFSAAEHDEYQAAGAPHLRRKAFYRGWTRKEAYLKAWGTGLRFSSRRFTLSLGAEAGRILRATEMPDDVPERWHFADRDLGDYQLAACWEEERRVLFRRFDSDAGVGG